MFHEIVRPVDSTLPSFVEVYILTVQPQYCGKLVKWLSTELPLSKPLNLEGQNTEEGTRSYPLLDLSHLKRVRKTVLKKALTKDPDVVSGLCNNAENEIGRNNSDSQLDAKRLKLSTALVTDSAESGSPSVNNKLDMKANKSEVKLQVILGSVNVLDETIDATTGITRIEIILERIDDLFRSHLDQTNKLEQKLSISTNDMSSPTTPVELSRTRRETVTKENVPARYSTSESEWSKFNTLWPVHYFPNKMINEQAQQLSSNDKDQMTIGMMAAIKDAGFMSTYNMAGAVVVDPVSSKIIATASSELIAQQTLMDQQQSNSSKNHKYLLGEQNRLVSATVLACQGVSRIERQNAIGSGMSSDDFQKGQYLCTGYDVYTTREPSTFEAMALVHSRINRLVFGCSVDCVSSCAAPHGSGIIKMQVHALPGTNHKYRVFMCQPNSELWKLCRQAEDTRKTG
jgi:tRNA(Arg) A34 adenosine deaminase TadA